LSDAAGAAESPPACSNCGSTLAGPYCHRCGQHAGQTHSLRAFLADAFSDLFNFRARTPRSLLLLVAKPGTLTHDWWQGRRVRHTQPVQLYLIAAAVFFLANSIHPFIQITADNRIVSSLSGGRTEQDIDDDQLAALQNRGISADEFRSQFRNTVNQSLPQFMAGSILLFTLALQLFSPRQPAMLHAVFALHWTGFFLLLMSFERLFASSGSATLAARLLGALTLVHLVLSLRRVYGHSWPRAALSGFALILVFNAILVGWVFAVVQYAYGRI
jgi:hypothetical protein